MLWNKQATLLEESFELEADLEEAILETAPMLFGPDRVYLDVKKKIGVKGRAQNIPDGYLIDLASARSPRLFVVENELSSHDPLRHVAVQILKFSLSFKTNQPQVKSILRNALNADQDAFSICKSYAETNGFENVDLLLERMIYGENKFNALVIIDSLEDELEQVLVNEFNFPVEILTLQRYRDEKGERLYGFEPFLEEISTSALGHDRTSLLPALDPDELDTVVIPARDEGFEAVFLGEDRWHKIKMRPSIIPLLKYIAAYRVAPTSAITHLAEIESIEQWPNSPKYVVNFAAPARKIGPIKLVPKSAVKAPQNLRYTSHDRLVAAKTLDEAF